LVSEKSIDEKGVRENDVWQIPFIAPSAKERLGYPTQKPEALLEKIILASSDEGDWVLDPFCGCGTTVAVAERLHRNWVGIDISMLAINVIAKRMRGHYPNIQLNIDGIPADYEGAVKLAEEDKFAFQDWAISLIDANPPSGETKKGADRGIDGIILFYDREDLQNPKLRKIIVQVKGGHTSRADIATLKGDIDRENAPMGVLITLNEPTKEMEREASLAGQYKYSSLASFPKIQILSIKDYFNGKKILLPTDKVNPFKEAEVKADQGALDF
jgi:site-specific DNA-methyltransferase (adenine-specific)